MKVPSNFDSYIFKGFFYSFLSILAFGLFNRNGWSDMYTFALIIIVFISIIVYCVWLKLYLKESEERLNKLPNNAKQKNSSLTEEDCSEKRICYKGGMFTYNSDKKTIDINGTCYKCSDLFDFETRNQQSQTIKGGEYVTKTNTGNMLGRAIVGGVLTGGVGAVIGAATASKDTVKVADSKIVNIDNFSVVLYFVNKEPIILSFGTNTYKFNSLVTILKHIVLNNAEQNKKQISSQSISDELQKLAELKEKGILTEEEFQTQKTKLLEY